LKLSISDLQETIDQQKVQIAKKEACDQVRDYLLDNGFSSYQGLLDKISDYQKNINQIASEIQRIENDDITVIDPIRYWGAEFEQFEAAKAELEKLRSQRGSNMPIPFADISSDEFKNIPLGCYNDTDPAECRGELLRHLKLEKRYINNKKGLLENQSKLNNLNSIKEQYLLLKQQCDSL